MAKIIDRSDRIVPVWLSAARHLCKQPDRNERNLILEIANPLAYTEQDKEVVDQIDAKIKSYKSDLSIETVASTIFPQSTYKHYGRPNFYKRYLEIMQRAKKPNTWGTYAIRMMSHQSWKEKAPINPLEKIVQKLEETKKGRKIRSAYELGIADPTVDLDCTDELNCELPIHSPVTDGGRPTNRPCLSHLSFKLDGDKIDLTAIYRSHHYAARALGNLIGLARLQNFVAKESGYGIGTLTCVATHAHLDVSSWGGKASTESLLKSLPTNESL